MPQNLAFINDFQASDVLTDTFTLYHGILMMCITALVPLSLHPLPCPTTMAAWLFPLSKAWC